MLASVLSTVVPPYAANIVIYDPKVSGYKSFNGLKPIPWIFSMSHPQRNI
jgi:hypothetical protein